MGGETGRATRPSDIGVHLPGGKSADHLPPGDYKTLCPKCSHTRKHRADPCLSLSIRPDGDWVVQCFNCAWASGRGGDTHRSRFDYVKPRFVPREPVDKVIDWFWKRGIPEQIVRAHQISLVVKGFPDGDGGWQDLPALAFPFFRAGEVVNVKYRTADKRFQQEKNAEKILFNIDGLAGQTWGILTEGEIDAMSFEAADYPNVASVPDGAPEKPLKEGHKRLDWLINCEAQLMALEKVYLAFDADGPGEVLTEEVARRLGKERCWRVRFPAGYKDANEVLMGNAGKSLPPLGATALRQCVEAAEPYPVEGLRKPEQFLDGVLKRYREGRARGLSTGLSRIDELFTLVPGRLYLGTGYPGCLTGDTEILQATGEWRRVEAMAVADSVACFDDYRHARDRVRRWWRSGTKPVFRVKTRRGEEIRATADHRFLSFGGWRRLADLCVGDFLAVPRTLPEPAAPEPFDLDDARLLALWIAEGRKNYDSFAFSSGHREIVAEVHRIATRRRWRVTRDGAFGYLVVGDKPLENGMEATARSQAAWYYRTKHGMAAADAASAAEARVAQRLLAFAHPNALLERHGLRGATTATVRVPAAIFRASNAVVSAFLNWLWACDGGVVPAGLEFTSVSEGLCRDVQRLLRRFGIAAIVSGRSVRYHGLPRPAWRVTVNATYDLERFRREIGILGKEDRLAALLSLRGAKDGAWDNLPGSVLRQLSHGWKYYRRHIGFYIKTTDRERQAGRVRRTVIAAAARHDENEALLAKIDRDVVWDEITVIEPVGTAETYDMETMAFHNFIANGIVTHNSGKSEFLDQLAVNAVHLHDWAVAYWSAENEPEEHLPKLIEKHWELPFWDGPRPRMSEQDVRNGVVWAQQHFVFLGDDNLETIQDIDWVLAKAKAAVLREGIRMLAIDPFNHIQGVSNFKSITDFVLDVLLKLSRFAKHHGVAVFLIAHPAKPPADERAKAPGPYSMAGSAHFFNAGDVIFSVHRDRTVETTEVEVQCWKVRFKWIGKEGMATLEFDRATGVYRDGVRPNRALGPEGYSETHDDEVPF